MRSVVLSGGIERVFTSKANWMAVHGHDVLFLTYEQGKHPFSYSLNKSVKHEDLDCRFFKVYQKNYLTRPIHKFLLKKKFRYRLKLCIEKFHPDTLIVPHNITEYLDASVSMNCYVPVILELHSVHQEILSKKSKWYDVLKRKRWRNYLNKSSLVVALTERDANYWRQYCYKVKVIPNSLPNYIDILPSVQKNPYRIICAARLESVKRIDRLIDAFSLIAGKYPSWFVDIYGSGQEKEQLLLRIGERGLENKIHLLSPIHNIYSEYMKSQFLVLSSDFESFSMVLIEAMSCGIPVVSTNCPYGPSEIIADRKNGLLSNMDVNDLSAKMEWMITHPLERQEMGIRAHQDAARYKEEEIMKLWEKIY